MGLMLPRTKRPDALARQMSYRSQDFPTLGLPAKTVTPSGMYPGTTYRTGLNLFSRRSLAVMTALRQPPAEVLELALGAHSGVSSTRRLRSTTVAACRKSVTSPLGGSSGNPTTFTLAATAY